MICYNLRICVIIPISRASLATYHDSKHSVRFMHMDLTKARLITCGGDKIIKVSSPQWGNGLGSEYHQLQYSYSIEMIGAGKAFFSGTLSQVWLYIIMWRWWYNNLFQDRIFEIVIVSSSSPSSSHYFVCHVSLTTFACLDKFMPTFLWAFHVLLSYTMVIFKIIFCSCSA